MVMTTEQDGKMMRRYWTNACPNCLLKSKCTTGNERRIPRWEHEHVLEAAQKRLDENPQAMRARRETVEHPFGTLKMRMLLASCYGHLGRAADARAAWAELLKVNPDFSLMQRARALPYKDARDFQRITEGLAKAGLP